MLYLHQSNRLERLADGLAALLQDAPAGPFTPEIVAVQSTGMARWLSLELATRLGVLANVQFPFPARLLWDISRAALPDLPERSPYAPEVLVWRIMGLLPGAADNDDPVLAPIRAYADPDDDLRRFQLARRIADLFDQYLVYRPDWILDWERTGGSSWHGRLWRLVVESIGRGHRVHTQARVLAALDERSCVLPPRLSLFGISSLPPQELAAFAAMAAQVDVHLFVMNPCRQYWAEIRSEREIVRRAQDHDPRDLYLESGHPLLASWGRQSQAFLALLQEWDPIEDEAFEEPAAATLLTALQADMLHLRQGAEDGVPRLVAAADRSLQVHVCHSSLREVEVLYDRLLALFEAWPDLTPGDVAVMAPDIEGYAPAVEAVFGAAEQGRRIPFSIADRPQRTDNPVASALLRVLSIVEGRFGADEVVGLLEADPVRQRFGLAETDVALVREWIRAVGIRWGLDAASRAALELPATAEHTWRMGLDRLLLGYALPAASVYRGVLPFPEVEGAPSRIAGRLATLLEALTAARDDLSRRRAVPEWAETLRRLLDRFVQVGEAEEQNLSAVRLALGRLAADACEAAYADGVSLGVMRTALETALADTRSAGRFRTGRVTFCALVPMRSVPFKVICLLGMNDTFPRIRRAPGFDLMNHDVRPGDRSRREDDRTLFLEALLSAPRVLYLSYVGQDLRDNRPISPSALVSELLDTVDADFTSAPPHGKVREQIVTRHPLHAFSPRYFQGDPALFSYAEEFAEASRKRGSAAPLPFIVTRLPEPAAEWRTVDLGQFIRFFQHPTKYLVRERLRMRVEDRDDVVDAREPFALDGLAAYGVREELLRKFEQGIATDDALAQLKAGGRLPQGRVGEVLLTREAEQVAAVWRAMAAYRGAEILEPLAIDLALGPLRLTGWLKGVRSSGILEGRPTDPKPKDRIALWIRHLLLNLLRPPDAARDSRWLGTGKPIQLRPVDDATGMLCILAELYWAGLCEPLHLFPVAGCAYADTLHKGGMPESALRKAETAWRGNEYSAQSGEGADAYHAFVFRADEPLDDAFERLSRTVFLPILEHEA